MPACIALSATGVRAAPSNGSSTIASTLSLMKVSIWLIWVLTSFVPSATFRSTSSYFSASAFAAFVMPAIQPWSAAGAEKPMGRGKADGDRVAGLVVVAGRVVAAAAPGALRGVPGTTGQKGTDTDDGHRG